MPRATLFVTVAVLMGTVAIFAFTGMPDNAGRSWQEVEALANAPGVETENETPMNETLPPESITESAEVDLTIDSPIEQEVPANYQFFTVDGYDPMRAREYLIDTDMPVPLRQEYLSRLEKAYGDEDKMAAVLKELRAQLQLG